MREYNEMMLRPVLYRNGQVHEDPARRAHRVQQAATSAGITARRRRAHSALVGGALLLLLVAF